MALGHLKWLINFIGMPLEKVKAEDGLEARLKIQKAVFLLKHLGVQPFTSYNFNMYLMGPYSPALVEHYYSLEEDTPPLDVSIDGEKEGMLRWFISNDPRWLEVASSIISLRRAYPGISNNDVCSLIRMSKRWVTPDEFARIHRDLESRGLI